MVNSFRLRRDLSSPRAPPMVARRKKRGQDGTRRTVCTPTCTQSPVGPAYGMQRHATSSVLYRLGVLPAAFAACAACASVLGAQGRNLHWRSIDVDARLDAQGLLHVRERQAIVFTGDWNGGERRFRVGPYAQLMMGPLMRVDTVTGEETPLRAGGTARVDGYTWSTKNHVLRWRSRRPSDPPFANTEIDYVIEYVFGDILIADGNTYRLDHDFAFTDRSGTIEQFTLRLTLDPAWRAPADFAREYTAHNLRPGQDYNVSAPLTYVGAGSPARVIRAAPHWLRVALVASLAVVLLLLVVQLLRRERSLGRFAPLTPAHEIDETWLRENVLQFLPEVVGAAWDDTTGAPEVAAVLARLVAEKKLASTVTRTRPGLFSHDVLCLELLVERSEFNEYERTLIDALFAPGDRTTDTDAVRERYKRTGFDPAGKIRVPLEMIIKTLNGPDGQAAKPRKRATLLLFLAAIAFSVVTLATRPGDKSLLIPGWGISVGLFLFAVIAAGAWQKRVERFAVGAVWFAAPLAGLLGGLAWVLFMSNVPLGVWTVGAMTALVTAFTLSVFHAAASREGPRQIAFRKRLASARRFFVAQLQERQPRLRDEWYPYLIAFGLGPQMDRWFRAFGSVGGSSATGVLAASAVSSHGGSHGGGWTGFGGGGGFAGGGASGSWTSAVSSIAAGVASPGSGGSGHGGGGGGGSSGGGGGGGW